MFLHNTGTSCQIVNCVYNQRNLKPPVNIVSNGSSKSWTNFTGSLQDYLMICWSRYLFGKNKSNVTIASCKTIFSGILRFPWLQQHIEKKSFTFKFNYMIVLWTSNFEFLFNNFVWDKRKKRMNGHSVDNINTRLLTYLTASVKTNLAFLVWQRCSDVPTCFLFF